MRKITAVFMHLYLPNTREIELNVAGLFYLQTVQIKARVPLKRAWFVVCCVSYGCLSFVSLAC